MVPQTPGRQVAVAIALPSVSIRTSRCSLAMPPCAPFGVVVVAQSIDLGWRLDTPRHCSRCVGKSKRTQPIGLAVDTVPICSRSRLIAPREPGLLTILPPSPAAGSSHRRPLAMAPLVVVISRASSRVDAGRNPRRRTVAGCPPTTITPPRCSSAAVLPSTTCRTDERRAERGTRFDTGAGTTHR